MIIEFTDRNYATLYDCLALTRDRIRAEGRDTPDIDATIAKLGQWCTPQGCQFLAVTGDDAEAVKTLGGAVAALADTLGATP